jgi:hypothetical protein
MYFKLVTELIARIMLLCDKTNENSGFDYYFSILVSEGLNPVPPFAVFVETESIKMT